MHDDVGFVALRASRRELSVCMGPAGNSTEEKGFVLMPKNDRSSRGLDFDMDLHLVDGVVQITARIPSWSLWLSAALLSVARARMM